MDELVELSEDVGDFVAVLGKVYKDGKQLGFQYQY